jgi:Xaa-Pro aminopeptidase
MLGPMTDHRDRLARAQACLQGSDLDALIITPGPNLRYLTGFAGSTTSERLTCLLLPAAGSPTMVVPLLERPLVETALAYDLEVLPWNETDDPLARLSALLPRDSRRLAVDERMWAGRSLRLRTLRPEVEQVDAAPVMRSLRIVKTAEETDSLRRAGAAIDSVHGAMGQWLRAGRTEREVAVDIADAILAAGHRSVEFVIVASGPNGASPHAEVSDRLIERGDPVVVDIGGAMPDGYNSDCTRTYVTGDVPSDFAAYYAVLLEAQKAQCEAVRPGMTPSELDALGRRIITDAGYGALFIHRTGHGIGLETHEDPYIVEGNDEPLAAGMAFSIEPGIYLTGRHGARIEDIVVCTGTGAERLNTTSRELAVLN